MDSSNHGHMDLEIPIALRRGKRRSSALASPAKKQLDKQDPEEPAIAATPARRSKRVRFSDSYVPSSTVTTSTGITPHLRRASLGTPRTRRRSTPARSDVTNDLLFTPLKQVLDERVKRRIRRNGLSEEMNEYDAEKKTRVALQKEIDNKDAELKRLRAELDAALATTPIAQDETSPVIMSSSQERVNEVEAELEALRQSFALEESQSDHAWTHVPRGVQGPSSDGGDTILIYEDDDVRETSINPTMDCESLAMGLELEAAKQAKQSLLGSFRDSTSSAQPQINFPDSPARRHGHLHNSSINTPRTFYHDLSKQLKATTSRAEDAELALRTLEVEVTSLGFTEENQSALATVTAILNHFRQARIDLERTVPGETVIGFENAKVLPEVIAKLQAFGQQLKTKEAELKVARDQQQNLKGNFEKAIVAAEKANARIKDLEAAIDGQAEDMLETRVRAQRLEKDLTEKEKDVESLTTALNKYRDDIARLETLITQLEQEHADKLDVSLSEQAQTISDLDAKVDAETRGRRAAEHSAVSRLAKINELELNLSAARQNTSDLELQISCLQSQITTNTSTHSQEIGSLNTRISNLSTALTHANAEVYKLRTVKGKLESRLRDEVENGARAVEAIQADLIRSVAKTNEDKKKYIRGAKVRIANWEMELDDEATTTAGESAGDDDASSSVVGPMTPSSLVRFADLAEEIEFTTEGRSTRQHKSDDDTEEDARSEHVPGSVEVGRGKFRRQRSSESLRQSRSLSIGVGWSKPSSRRKYDSGIGMSPVSDSELQAAFEVEDHQPRGGLITPDLSSEGDEIERDRRVSCIGMSP